MKFKITIAILLFLFGCKSMDNINYSVYLFNKGEYTKVKSELSEKIVNILKDIVLDTDDMLRLHVSKERIETIKKNNSGIEVIFKKKNSITSKKMGVFEINKILIPFEGDFVGNENSPVVTVFLGNNGYITGPLRNSDGLKKLEEIKKVIASENFKSTSADSGHSDQ